MDSSPGVVRAPSSSRDTIHLNDDDLLLTRAAASIASDGRAHTIVDVLHARALNHYRRGLREYLAIRAGGLGAADAALKRLRRAIGQYDKDELVEAPGIRARMYRLARELVTEPRNGALPYRAPRHATESQVVRLREGLSPDHAELLELRYARELRPAEIAFVVGAEVEDVLEAMRGATQAAEKLARRRGSEPLKAIILEAFALDVAGPTGEELAEANDAPSLITGVCIGGRYVIQARVGTGAFGDVYRAEDAAVPGHVVALKLLHEGAYSGSARQGALRELRHIASVFHPSVVQFKDHGWHDGRLWFVMPWYDGETLESRLRRAPLSRREARTIFEPLARALAAMHAAGIRHQDVKPDNVFLAELGEKGSGGILPVLIDLGVAATEAEMLVAGTPTYFAPEVAAQFARGAHRPRVTAAADVFSLALTLRNALDPDAQEDVPAGAVEAFIEERARSVPEVPSGRRLKFLAPSFDRWMNLDADERPTADEFAEELAVLTRPEDRRRRRGRALRWALPLVGVLGAAFGGVVVHLQARAEAERSEARSTLQEVRQDLEATSADRERIASRYERMELSSAQLRDRLASAEAEGEVVARHLASARQELVVRSQSIEALQGELLAAQQAAEASRAEANAAQESARSSALERDEAAARARRAEEGQAAVQRELDARETELTAARTRVATTEARLAAADARADALEAAVERAMAARPARVVVPADAPTDPAATAVDDGPDWTVD